MLAVMTSFSTLVDIQTSFLLHDLVPVPAAASVGARCVFADVITITRGVVCGALVLVNATICSKKLFQDN